ncbi:MAG: glycosyltransferase [Bacteroidota bacterium]
MTIAFLFKFIGAEIGGSYTFQKNFLDSLLSTESNDQVYIFYFGKLPEQLHPLKSNFQLICLDATGNNEHTSQKSFKSIFKKLIPGSFIQLKNKVDKLHRVAEKNYHYYYNFNNLVQKKVEQLEIDFIHFVHPSYYPVKIPFSITVWDLAHRRHPYLPEESFMYDNWERKDNFFRMVLPKASMIVTGTAESKKQIIKYYNCEEELIQIIPFPIINDIYHAEKADISSIVDVPFIFYPAQFWSQKNHILILLALRILKDQEITIKMIFTGSDQGNYQYIKTKTEELDLTDSIIFTEFVGINEMKALYQNALFMVFPAIIGPDNLPPIEAMSLDCPVLSGSYDGVHDQLGDAAIIFNNLDEHDLAEKIKLLLTDESKRKELIAKGKQKIAEVGNFDTYVSSYFSKLIKYKNIIRAWKNI